MWVWLVQWIRFNHVKILVGWGTPVIVRPRSFPLRYAKCEGGAFPQGGGIPLFPSDKPVPGPLTTATSVR